MTDEETESQSQWWADTSSHGESKLLNFHEFFELAGHHVGSLKLGKMVVYTPWQWANTTFPRELSVKHTPLLSGSITRLRLHGW